MGCSYTSCVIGLASLLLFACNTFALDADALVGQWYGLRSVNAGISSTAEEQCFQSRDYGTSNAMVNIEYAEETSSYLMQLDFAGTFLSPIITGRAYYATAAPLSSSGTMITTTNHISFYDSALDTVYCSYTSLETFTPTSSTPVVAERTFRWLNPSVLTLAMTTNDCPLSFISPYCAGPPVSTSSPFSQIFGFSLSKDTLLTGRHIYMAQLMSAPGVTRIVLSSHSGPVDVVLIDENNFQRFSAGLNFRFYPWFSFLGVEALDQHVTLSGDMSGNYYYMVTYARSGDRAVIKPAANDHASRDTYSSGDIVPALLASRPSTTTHDTTSTTHGGVPTPHKTTFASLGSDAISPSGVSTQSLSRPALSTQDAPLPPTLSVTLMVASVGIESSLVPLIPQARSQELYVSGPSGAGPSWLWGVVIAAGAVVLLGAMGCVVWRTRVKDRGGRFCCRCCYNADAGATARVADTRSKGSPPGAEGQASLASMQTRKGEVWVECGVLPAVRNGLYAAYGTNTSAVPSNAAAMARGVDDETPYPSALHSLPRGTQSIRVGHKYTGESAVVPEAELQRDFVGEYLSVKGKSKGKGVGAPAGEGWLHASSAAAVQSIKAKKKGKKEKKSKASVAVEEELDVYHDEELDADDDISLASYLGASDATVSFSTKHIPRTSMAATVSDAAIASGQYGSPASPTAMPSAGLSELLFSAGVNTSAGIGGVGVADGLASKKLRDKSKAHAPAATAAARDKDAMGSKRVPTQALAKPIKALPQHEGHGGLQPSPSKGSLMALRTHMDADRLSGSTHTSTGPVLAGGASPSDSDKEDGLLRMSTTSARPSVIARQAELFKPRSMNVHDKAFFSYDAAKEEKAAGNGSLLASLARLPTTTASAASAPNSTAPSPALPPRSMLTQSSSMPHLGIPSAYSVAHNNNTSVSRLSTSIVAANTQAALGPPLGSFSRQSSLTLTPALAPVSLSAPSSFNNTSSGGSLPSSGSLSAAAAPKYLPPLSLAHNSTRLSTLSEAPVLTQSSNGPFAAPAYPQQHHFATAYGNNNNATAAPAAAAAAGDERLSMSMGAASGVVRVGKLRLKPQVR